MKYIVFLTVILSASLAFGVSTYSIEATGNDEVFVINGETYKAKTYCFGFDEGDRVIFLEGSSLGVCVSAKIYNKTKRKSCDLWCE